MSVSGFLRRVREVIAVSRTKSVVVAYSAGADSTLLLHLLHIHFGKNIGIRPVYFQHGLRGTESTQEETFAKSVCAGLGLDLTVFPLGPFPSGNLQLVARESRYFHLERIRSEVALIQGPTLIATAHHSDDIAENFWIGLWQGRLDARMLPLPDFDPKRNLMRPLLDFDKAGILNELRELSLPYCEDSSNRSDKYLRNRIRQTGELSALRPLAEDISQIIERAEILSNQGLEAVFSQVCDLENEQLLIHTGWLRYWHEEDCSEFLRYCLKRCFKSQSFCISPKELKEVARRIKKQRYASGYARYEIGSHSSGFVEILVRSDKISVNRIV